MIQPHCRTRCFRVSLLALVLAFVAPAHAGNDGRIDGEWRSPGGVALRYELHFNHNAIRQSEVADGVLVALTDSGLLLRFRLQDMRLTGQRLPDRPLTCLGRGFSGRLFTGASDGTVRVLSPDSLEMTIIGRLPYEPVWLGSYPSGADEVVVGLTRELVRERRNGRLWVRGRYRIHVLGTDGSLPLDNQPDTVLLTSSGDLWVGSDHGEFGGDITVHDMKGGTGLTLSGACKEARRDERERFARDFGVDADQLDWGCEGVYGFLEEVDGSVLVYGGTSHMGLNSGYIARIRHGQMVMLAEFESGFGRASADGARPEFPITHILDGGEGRRIVFSYGEVFVSDAEFEDWTPIAEFPIRYRPGRPNAVGCLPSVVAVHPLAEAPLHLVVSTRLDGFLELESGAVTPHPVPGQLEADHVIRLAPVHGKLVAVDRQSYTFSNVPWIYDNSSWDSPDMEPPFEPDFGRWLLARVLPLSDGSLLALYDTNASPGPRLTLLWQAGNPSVRDYWKDVPSFWDLDAPTPFETADGTIWAVEDGTLVCLDDHSGWVPVGSVPEAAARARLRPVASLDEATLLLDEDDDGRRLWLLIPDDKENVFRLEPFEAGALGSREVHDALALDHETIMLATNRGIMILDATSRDVRPPDFSCPDRAVRVLARDAAGELWMAGDGLWVYRPGADRVEDLSDLPLLAFGKVLAMSAIHGGRFDVALSIENRGVVFLGRTRSAAAPRRD